MENPPLLVIVGETASGKSALALQLAQQLNGEIVCADSWTVRREVNIGTAKPTAEEQAIVPHHLLNIADPDEDFTAAVFKRRALEAIDEIADRGRLPLLVGGTGLYIDGVVYDFGFLPAGDRREREEFNRLSVAELLAEIEARGLELGGIDIRNKRRLIRLLETNGARPQRKELRANTVMIGLKTDRTILSARIEQRVDAMLAAGLEQEVKDLAEHYGWDCEALKGVGYAQWQDYFLGAASLETTRERIIKATRDLAKRQRTWFKRNPQIIWFDTPVDQASVVDFVTTHLNTQNWRLS
ncbi:MAG TPA: tRNA (adenosine(37)-N6)-dimethylallyltransferase MiaA [Candidatus Saccharimonadales bacterium]|nr:tRNA (adenosine(37)-N6)-dimethylallyltransferase MiaA [Candidatus Saccharimonadales bacterium]